MTNSKFFDSSLDQCQKATTLGNKIAIHMLELLGTSKHQPQGFEALANDFLQLCRVMWAVEIGLTDCLRNQQQVPADVIQEIFRKFKATNNDFHTLEQMISRFLEYEKRGTMGKIQRGWRKMFSEDDVGKMRKSLNSTRDAMKMNALMCHWSLSSERIDESVDIGYSGLATALDRLSNGRSLIGKAKSLQNSTSEKELLPMQMGLHTSIPSTKIQRHGSISNGTVSSRGHAMEPIHSPSEVRGTSLYQDSGTALAESETLFSDSDLSDSGPIKVVRLKPDPSSMPRWTPRNETRTQTPQYKAALISAVQARNSAVVEQLLDRGVSPNTGPDLNVLNETMAQHDLESARQLLMFGADVNAPDARGLTPLMCAIEHTFLDGATVLLKYGADPNLAAAGFESESPIAHAVNENYFNFVRLLLMYGADANHVAGNGETMLIRAISKNWQKRVINLLLDYGADPNGKTRAGVSPLFCAINSGRVELVTSLLDHGANPNLPGPKHMLWPAIHQIQCLKVLLARGADYKKAPGIMEQAASINNIEAIHVLLDSGVDPNAKKDGVYTPLCTSIRDDRKEIFHLLLSKGADPNVPASEYPAFKCVTHFRQYFLPYLVEAGADLRSPKGILETAVSSNNMEAFIWLLEAGVPPNDKAQKTGATALTTAIRENRMDYIELLLSKGADPNVRGEDWPIFMAVHQPEILRKVLPRLKEPRAYKGVMERAVVANQLDSIKLLLAAGVSVEDRNGGVFSPLTSAIRDRQKDIVRFLIDEGGADVNAPGEHLPIVKALRRYEGDDYEIIKMLLAKGSDPNKIYRGHSGFIQAVENGDAQVLRLLIDYCGVDFATKDDAGQDILQIVESRGWEEGIEIFDAATQSTSLST
ncbi:ankyrin repeat-containing domain protein [Xylariales sp. PMI_506]|nr:ankyrin repeat-containing domain protein [Xylariales sp. PMI_506]